jgi:hypothetical protein
MKGKVEVGAEILLNCARVRQNYGVAAHSGGLGLTLSESA